MSQLFKLLIITIILTSCKHENNGFKITGNIKGIKDSTLIKLYDLERQFYIDSTYSHNGNFTLQGKVEKPTTCWLRTNGESIVIQVENLDLTFTSTVKDMRLNSKITGGREQDLQNELQKLQKPYDIIFLELMIV